MRKYAVGAVVLTVFIALVIAGPAFAQDNSASAANTKIVASTTSTLTVDAAAPTPAPAPKKGSSSGSGEYRWSGFSLGASFGYALSNGDTIFNPGPNPTTFFNLMPQTLALHPHGVIGGLQAGWDHKQGMWVYGLTVDFSGTGIQGITKVSPITNNVGLPFSPAGGSDLAAKEELKYLATIRGRIGVVADKRLLFYATGGAAGGRFIFGADSNFEPFGSEDFFTEISRMKVGWTVGGGIEYAACRHWHVGAEYLYYDFPNESKTANPNPTDPPLFVVNNWAAKGQIARAVFSYKF
ncbi:MAG: outer membrane beta-barrel protein [Candidatus Acidiferrales bacterium]